MNLGPWEIIIILVVVLVLFGPSRLPKLGRSVGEAIRGFKSGLNQKEEPDAPPTETPQNENQERLESGEKSTFTHKINETEKNKS